MAEEVKGERLDQQGPKRLEEVQRQAPAAVFGGMQQAQRGVEAVAVDEGDGLVVNERRAEGDAGIDGIERRTRTAPLEREVGRQKFSPGLKVTRGGSSFVAA